MSKSRDPTRSPAQAALIANLVVLYVVFGSTYLAIRIMVQTIPALAGAGLRFLVAGALIYGWCAYRHGALPRLGRRDLAGTALIGLLVIGGALGLLTLGERTVPSGLAALLVASVPAWIVLLRTLHREQVTTLTGLGVVVGLGGVALLSGTTGFTGGSTTGIVILLIAAGCEAVGTYLTPRFSLPDDPILAAALQMLISGPVLLVAGLVLGEDIAPSSWSTPSLLALLYLIGPGSVLAYASYVWTASRAPASIASTYTYVNPAVALLLGWIVLDEQITTAITAGAMLVIVGVAAVLAGERRANTDNQS